MIGFAFVERRAAEPILPGWVFRNRLLNSTNLAALGAGVMLIVLTSFIPLYAQGVLRTSALVAGFALAALTLGWPLAASMAGRIYLRIGFRRTALIGAAVVMIGSGLLALLSSSSSVWQVAATCFVMGLGMGLVVSPTLISAQSSVEWERRGVVTGTNMFATVNGQRAGHRGLRRDCQRVAQPTGGRAHLLHRQRNPGQYPRARAAQGLSERRSGRSLTRGRGAAHAEALADQSGRAAVVASVR